MTGRRYLGDRASVVLGLLVQPRTTREVYEMIPEVIESLRDGSRTPAGLPTLKNALAALEELRAGTHVVRRELERLEAANYVRRQAGVADHDAQLWWRA